MKEIENWPEVLRYYLLRETRDPVAIQFRNGEVLRAPRDYNFGAIAETLLVDSYRFNPYSAVTVDIGASIGDFALLASRHKSNRVYAYEKDPGYYRYLRENMSLNHRNEVRTFNASANRHTLTSIIGDWESKIDFLKVDCEGCEYDLLMQCPREVLSRVSTIAVEVHERPPYSKASLIAHLKGSGFQVFEDKRFGRGHHVHAARKLLVSG